MELTRAYKFRIYPDAKRQKEIDERLILGSNSITRFSRSQSHPTKSERQKSQWRSSTSS